MSWEEELDRRMTAFLDSKHCKRPDLWPLTCLLSIVVDFSVAKNCFLRKKMLCRKREHRNVTSCTKLIADKIILRSLLMFCCRHGDCFSSLRSVNVVAHTKDCWNRLRKQLLQIL